MVKAPAIETEDLSSLENLKVKGESLFPNLVLNTHTRTHTHACTCVYTHTENKCNKKIKLPSKKKNYPPHKKSHPPKIKQVSTYDSKMNLPSPAAA